MKYFVGHEENDYMEMQVSLVLTLSLYSINVFLKSENTLIR